MKRIVFLLSVFLFLSVPAVAQLCTGSLGDPAVLIDFGSKETPLAPLTPSNISYTLSANGCPNPGEYGLRNLLFNCFNNTWLTTVADHTPSDVQGDYLLV